MGAVTAALIGFFAFVILRVTAVPLVTLYTDLSYEDSSAIIKDLERQAIAYQIKNDGAIIMVPQDKVARLRMKLAEGGLPKGGGIGYEIFDKSEALGTTSFVQNINHLRALEGELGTHHSFARPGRDGPGASCGAGTAAVLARQDRTFGFNRREGPWRARDAAGPRMRQLVASAVNGLKAAADLDRGRKRPPAGGRHRRRRQSGRRRQR